MSPRYAMSPRPAITCAGYPLVSTQLMHESQRSGCWLQQASTKLFSQALAALDTSAGSLGHLRWPWRLGGSVGASQHLDTDI